MFQCSWATALCRFNWKLRQIHAEQSMKISPTKLAENAAVTNARFAALHGLPVVPVPLSTTPAPLRKPRARHELAWCRAAGAAGFRLRPGGGTLRSGCVSLGVSLRLRSTFPARRPQTEASSKGNVAGIRSWRLKRELNRLNRAQILVVVSRVGEPVKLAL